VSVTSGSDRAAAGSREIEVEGRRFAVSNFEKVLWRDPGFTKGQMIGFYRGVAPALLLHLERRPVTLRRFPDGVEGCGWYQFQWPKGHPDWLPSHPVPGRTRKVWDFCLVNDLSSLLWAANLAAIELHPFLARADRLDEPTVVVFDLDPGPPADVVECCEVALYLRDMLADLGLASLAKTSGSVGLHVYVPLNTAHTFHDTKAFARSLASRLAAEHAERVTDDTRKSSRAGKVLIDWIQNDATRSTVAAYSLRATAWPTVSTPVTWEEVERAAAARKPELLTFDPADVLMRLDRFGDLFRPVVEMSQTLPS
jgi:bifunctional non-homologous end joining protein LigD